MKKLHVFIFILLNSPLVAQNRLPALRVSHTIKPDIEKVAQDYYDHFQNIIGEKISESINTIEYQSKLVPAGALESTVLEIKGLKNVYSWQATMLSTEEYEKAVEKYKQFYRQLNGANFIMPDHKSWKFRGPYDNPDESRAFASSILEPDVDIKALQKLKVEIALNYDMPEWTVRILVYEKEADEDIRPTEVTGQDLNSQ